MGLYKEWRVYVTKYFTSDISNYRKRYKAGCTMYFSSYMIHITTLTEGQASSLSHHTSFEFNKFLCGCLPGSLTLNSSVTNGGHFTGWCAVDFPHIFLSEFLLLLLHFCHLACLDSIISQPCVWKWHLRRVLAILPVLSWATEPQSHSNSDAAT